MQVGDLVYPFYSKESLTMGLILGIQSCNVRNVTRASVLINGEVYSLPTHQIRQLNGNR